MHQRRGLRTTAVQLLHILGALNCRQQSSQNRLKARHVCPHEHTGFGVRCRVIVRAPDLMASWKQWCEQNLADLLYRLNCWAQ